MKYLLQDSFSEYFNDKYPLIYKNKFRKAVCSTTQEFYYRNAIETALVNN